MVEAQESKRKQLESGNWIQNLPTPVYESPKGMLELRLETPTAPVKATDTNTSTDTP